MKVARLAALTLALAVVLHLGIVWLIPQAITGIFMSRVIAQAGANHVLTPPLPTDTARSVVMPSPDLLYAVCVYDLAAGPVRITAQPPGGYWSAAIYDRNSDNIFTLNDRDLAGRPLDLILTPTPNAGLQARFPAARIVQPPHGTGVLLVRALVLDATNMQPALQAQASVHCTPTAPAG